MKHEPIKNPKLIGCLNCSPIPSVSCAGKRRGEADDRYLWPEMLRIIKALRPRWVLGENVAGIVDMALDIVLFDLESEGYETGAFIIPACAVGAPHRRDRVWIVAHFPVPGNGEERRNADGSGKAQSGEDVANANSKHGDNSGYRTGKICRQRNQAPNLPSGKGHVAYTNRERQLQPQRSFENFGRWSGNGSQDVADTKSQRCGYRDDGENKPKNHREINSFEYASLSCGKSQNVADTKRTRSQGENDMGESTLPAECCGRPAQSGVGRNFARLPSRLAGHRWPASYGCEQYEWEPPRVTTEKAPYHRQKLQVLGNTVIPQIVEVIGRAIIMTQSCLWTVLS